jgi:Ca-activated chloride channel family protein
MGWRVRPRGDLDHTRGGPPGYTPAVLVSLAEISLLKKSLAVVAVAALPATVFGQVPSFSARSDLVVLSATAVDRKGRPVTNLRREEFRVFEEGRPQAIVRFHDARELPARVLLLVDGSGSMGETSKMTSVRRAAERVLFALRPDDQIALAGFDSRYFGLVRFTRDREAVRRALATVEPFGSTALHDALDQAASDIASHGEGRRAVVVITDGVDTASQKTPATVLEHSRALDVPIYALTVVSGLEDPASPLFLGHKEQGRAAEGAEALARYAALSGGAAFRVSTDYALTRAANSIALELEHQYRLGYDPPAGPDRFRRVEVRTTRKGVTVRTRSGYVPPSRETSAPAGRAGPTGAPRSEKEGNK